MQSKLTFGQWARGVPEQVRFQLQDQRFPQWCLRWQCISPEPPRYGRRRSCKHRYLHANNNKISMTVQLIFEMKAAPSSGVCTVVHTLMHIHLYSDDLSSQTFSANIHKTAIFYTKITRISKWCH